MCKKYESPSAKGFQFSVTGISRSIKSKKERRKQKIQQLVKDIRDSKWRQVFCFLAVGTCTSVLSRDMLASSATKRNDRIEIWGHRSMRNPSSPSCKGSWEHHLTGNYFHFQCIIVTLMSILLASHHRRIPPENDEVAIYVAISEGQPVFLVLLLCFCDRPYQS